MIQMQPVKNNSRFRALGYDAQTRTLAVELADGSAWEYPGVWPAQYERLGGPDADVTFDGIEWDARLTKRRIEVEPEPEMTAGERIHELGVSAQYGPKGSATRAQYDRLQERLAALPDVALGDRLGEVVELLAAVNPHSDSMEVAGLLLERQALELIISKVEPARAQIELELVSVRERFARGQASATVRRLVDARGVEQRRARLAELNELIAHPPAFTEVELKTAVGQAGSVAQAYVWRESQWKTEREQLRASLGLPPEEEVAPAVRSSAWVASVRASEERRGA